MHLLGQRFPVLAANGKRHDNLTEKDMVLSPSGATVDLLVDLSSRGRWMLHCHIAEPLEARDDDHDHRRLTPDVPEEPCAR